MTNQNLFVGTKTVVAVPMSLGEYNKLRGWTIPKDEDPAAEGYLVEYQNGGAPNHPDYAGYISWSPKEIFESSYRSIGNAQETDQLVIKLIGEFNALNDLTEPLRVFLSKPKPNFISEKEWLVLHDQLDAMADYRDCLLTRISIHTLAQEPNVGALGEA